MPSEKTAHSIGLSQLKGIGPVMAAKLAALGMQSIMDLLFHLPLRYQDRTRVMPIGSLQNGESAVIEGEIRACDIVFGKRRSLLCKVQDGSGVITLRFFHFSAAQKQRLVAGEFIRCFGDVSLGRGGLEIIHPEYQLIESGSPLPDAAHLTAIYPSVDGIHQARWRNYIKAAFEHVQPQQIPELLPESLWHETLQSAGEDIYFTLRQLHFPPPDINIAALSQGLHPLQRRLAFEELVAQRLSHLLLRRERVLEQAQAMPASKTLAGKFLDRLDFQLTQAQQKVLEQIKKDVATETPMLRLLQGDVGSGKTVVAAISALPFFEQGKQVAIMAPTEILAEQHYQTFTQWFAPLDIEVTLLVSKLPAAEKRNRLEFIRDGRAQCVIGTHALIQDDVTFADLGLVIIDEQHRFGVDQRRALKNKREDGLGMHQLVMTATPIPRTLAMTFYADLDYSVIDELPPGRTPVETVALGNDRRQQVIERVHQACREGKQVYWICTLVEESETLQCQAAESTATELAQLLPDISIGLVHGRLKPEQKHTVMQHFSQANIQLLVATTVIEVGVNVPNASLMIIENPERLGLSQLHQLRGRVGRGDIKSHCVLLYQKPLSKNGKQRIDIMRSTTDGFKLAEQDLRMRGPGQVLGTRQSGAAMFRLADLERDTDLIEAVVHASDSIAENDPNRANALIQRWCPLAENYIDV